ncbi:MAG TPA: hypothetical protein VGM78_12620 [Ilumatobacteraceae bacterium]
MIGGDGSRAATGSSVQGIVKNPVLVVVGVVVALLGLLFALQGFGVVHGSPMTSTITWSVAGPIICAAGVVTAIVGVRGRRNLP